jgi:hypothetical protein
MNTHKTRIVIALVFLAVAPATTFSQESDDGTVFPGRSHSFVLKEPAGWIMNSQTAKSQGLEVVLYREGSSWKDAVVVMYARVIHKDETQDTVEKVIANDVTDFLKLNKESKVSESTPLQTHNKKEAMSKVFYDAANKNYEIVTFIDEAKVVVILAMSSRNKSEYEKALPAFTSLVASYFIFTPLVGSQ